MESGVKPAQSKESGRRPDSVPARVGLPHDLADGHAAGGGQGPAASKEQARRLAGHVEQRPLLNHADKSRNGPRVAQLAGRVEQRRGRSAIEGRKQFAQQRHDRTSPPPDPASLIEAAKAGPLERERQELAKAVRVCLSKQDAGNRQRAVARFSYPATGQFGQA
jgi:hypothetical protein